MKSCSPSSPNYDYRAAGDLDTLTQAHEIRSDAKRHKKAKAFGAQKMSSMKAALSSKSAGSKR